MRTLLELGARVDDISLMQARNPKNPCMTEDILAMVEEAYAKQTGAVIPASGRRFRPSR